MQSEKELVTRCQRRLCIRDLAKGRERNSQRCPHQLLVLPRPPPHRCGGIRKWHSCVLAKRGQHDISIIKLSNQRCYWSGHTLVTPPPVTPPTLPLEMVMWISGRGLMGAVWLKVVTVKLWAVVQNNCTAARKDEIKTVFQLFVFTVPFPISRVRDRCMLTRNGSRTRHCRSICTK